MALKTRKPSGRPTWPVALIAGKTGTRKSYLSALASASPLIGRTLWLGYGERDPEEYGAIGDFEIVEHDGTVGDVREQIHAILSEPANADGRPTLVVLDSVSPLWEVIRGSIDDAAAERSREKQAPDGVGDIWEAGRKEWRSILDLLSMHNGPVIITARLEQTATGEQEWIKAERQLPFEVDAVVTMREHGHATIDKLRSIALQVDEALDWPDFTFDALWARLGLADNAAAERVYSVARKTPLQLDPSASASLAAPLDHSGRDWAAEAAAATTSEGIARLGAEASLARAPRAAMDAIRARREAIAAEPTPHQ